VGEERVTKTSVVPLEIRSPNNRHGKGPATAYGDDDVVVAAAAHEISVTLDDERLTRGHAPTLLHLRDHGLDGKVRVET
jgi:hypothetical protein